MPKVSLNTIGSRYGSIDALNDNFDAIEAAIENTLSLDGTSPNAMTADLDLNSNDLLNVGTTNTQTLYINGVEVEPSTGVSAGSAFQTYSFTATAGQTTFSVSPATPLVSSLLVSVNGLELPPADVTVSTTNVVIPACTLGDEVVIRRFTKEPTIYPTAATQDFQQAGAGAQIRTVQSKLRDVVSVKDFGAVGDGVTDDTAAIQTALNYAENGGKVVLFPAGVYIVSSALTVTNDSDGGITLEGESTSDYLFSSGSVLKYTGGAGTMLTFDGTASPIFCKLKNLTFLGNASADAGVKLNRGWFFNVEGCVFYDWTKGGASALSLTYSSGIFVGVVTVRDCVFSNCNVGIFWEKIDVNVIRVENCQFSSGSTGILQGASGVACSSRNVNITSCMFDGVRDYAIYSWGGAQNWNIIGNYFEQNNASVNTPRVLLNAQGASPRNCSVTIIGNTFSKQLAAASANLVYLNDVDGVVIENNWSAYGDSADRYSVEMASCINKRVMQFSAPSGSTPYPIKDGSFIHTTGSVERMAGGMFIQSAINFPATQSASTDPNALDDYEEGTWTPTNGYVSFTSATGTYVKVGQMVTATFKVTFPVNAQGNQAEILGIPFNRNDGAVTISYSDYGSAFYARMLFTTGAALYNLAGAALTNANFSGKVVEGTMVYRANA